MAKMSFTDAPKREFKPHPTGSFQGYIKEVRLEDPTEYPNDDGTVTIAERRRWIIENTDGHAEYSYTDREGVEQTGPMSIRSAPLNFYVMPDGNYRTPTEKSRIYEYYQTALGETPDWTNFDDECVLGVRVMYQVIHEKGVDKQTGKPVTYANIRTIMRMPDQSGNFEVITQAQRHDMDAERNGGNGNGQESPESDDGDDAKAGCERWISYLTEKGVYNETKAESYAAFIEAADAMDLKAFADKCQKDCEAAGVPIPYPHPMSSGDDDIPF